MFKKLMFFALLFLFPLRGQDVGTVPKTNPPVFALQGATVVVGNGEVLSNATVIIRDGLIEAVGTDVGIPTMAWRMDLASMYVYPGLIDALSEVPLKSTQSRQANGRRTRDGQDQENSEGPGLYPHIRAADRLQSGMERLSPWRNAGVLTVNAAPNQGIFMGQTAAVNLNGQDPDRMVVRSPIAMRVSFQNPDRGYPRSLMGVIAHIKQTLLDAQRYSRAWRIYDGHPSGLKRPETDRALEALRLVVEEGMPMIFPAKEAREVRRVFGILDMVPAKGIIAGGFEAHRLADELKDRSIPVLLSLNFPRKKQDVHPETEESLRELRDRSQAPRSAIRLQEAGVRFAFYSDGMKAGGEYLNNLRRVVREGLSSEAAIRSATLTAAQILGIDRQLGTVESGKIANLVVSDGELFNEDTKIRFVLVDGEKYDVQTSGEVGVADEEKDQSEGTLPRQQRP